MIFSFIHSENGKNRRWIVSGFIGIILSLSPLTLAGENAYAPNMLNKMIQFVENIPSGGTFNFTFKSKLDDSLQPMLIKIPPNYKKNKSWPLLVVLHGLGDGPIIVPSIDSMVQIGPFGRGDLWYRNMGEKDVLECVNLAREIFTIDPDRIYLCGFSMGAAGTFELGLKHPDIWAACVPVCGRLDNKQLIDNGINLPFWIHSGSIDKVVPAKFSKIVFDYATKKEFWHWRYTEHDEMGHSFNINWEEVEQWMLLHKRTPKPLQIRYSCVQPSRAYWAEITAIEKGANMATIIARIKEQVIWVNTTNILDYIIYADAAPLDISQEITIFENSKEIFRGDLSKDGIFKRNQNQIVTFGKQELQSCVF